MRFSEFKEHLKNSKIAETLLDIKRFYQKHKNLVYPFIIIIVLLSFIISPLVYKYLVVPTAEVDTDIPEVDKFIQNVTVYVTGEVNKPGVYTLTNEDRVEDAITAAGGLKDSAYIEYVNLAQKLYDEQHINIPSLKDKNNTSSSNIKAFSGVININKATAEEFKQLPGVGDVTANNIVEYRTNVGNFEDIRDIMNVKGVSESLFNKIRYNLTL